MANLGGKHVQAESGRELTYRCVYEVVGDTDLAYVAVVAEGLNYLGRHEASLRYDPFGIPVKSVVRMNLLRHLDRTTFGQGVLPGPKGIGWYGPYL